MDKKGAKAQNALKAATNTRLVETLLDVRSTLSEGEVGCLERELLVRRIDAVLKEVGI